MANEEEQEKTIPMDPDLEEMGETLFSPRFKSVAAMAGWDEEAILVASLVVEDTPDRGKNKKSSDLHSKTPTSISSRRKRRALRKSPISLPMPLLDLDEKEISSEEGKQNKVKPENTVIVEKRTEGSEESTSVVLPCMVKLREELSCAICLEICFEPSTTPCGHSFCKKCLKSAADKCGKRCPKCRQLISNGRSCTINTVLWNTIQLLFPQEIEARKAAGGGGGASNSGEAGNAIKNQISASRSSSNARRRHEYHHAVVAERFQREDLAQLLGRDGRRLGGPSQNEDAALALRLQREEFMDAFRDTTSGGGGGGLAGNSSLSLARANLRAMASRAVNNRNRQREHR